MRQWIDEEKPVKWEIIDVDEAYVFVTESLEARDAYIKAVEIVGHRVIVREVKR